jgi:hypothetical protein
MTIWPPKVDEKSWIHSFEQGGSFTDCSVCRETDPASVLSSQISQFRKGEKSQPNKGIIILEGS